MVGAFEPVHLHVARKRAHAAHLLSVAVGVASPLNDESLRAHRFESCQAMALGGTSVAVKRKGEADHRRHGNFETHHGGDAGTEGEAAHDDSLRGVAFAERLAHNARVGRVISAGIETYVVDVEIALEQGTQSCEWEHM